jgi:uncharacterized membrane protein
MVLYLTLREKSRVRMFQNRVLRRIFGPKTDEVTGEWRKLQNEELHNLYFIIFHSQALIVQDGPLASLFGVS